MRIPYCIDPTVDRFERRVLDRGVLSLEPDQASNRHGRRAQRRADATERATLAAVPSKSLVPGERRMAGGLQYAYVRNAAAQNDRDMVVPPAIRTATIELAALGVVMVEVPVAPLTPGRWFRIDQGPRADGTMFSPEACDALNAAVAEAEQAMPPWMAEIAMGGERAFTKLAGMRYSASTKQWTRSDC
jgi:hypothetical protein